MKTIKKNITKLIWFALFIFLLLTFTINLWKGLGENIEEGFVEVIEETEELNLNDFLSSYEEGKFEKIILKNETDLEGYEFIGTGDFGSFMVIKSDLEKKKYNQYLTKKPVGTSLGDLGISFTGETLVIVEFQQDSFWIGLMKDIIPLLLIIAVFVILFRFMGPKGGGLPFNMKIGREANKSTIKTRFKDVAGMEEVKEELSEIIDYLKNPQKYHKVGAKHPKGVLLYGPPGSGKTLLARAVAGEASVPFFSASGSEFMEMLVGMGAAKVRSLFNKAKASGRAIVFIDEIDAIGRKRGLGSTGGHQEQEQTLNQILTEMDGFDNTTQVIVIAATNRPDTLDSALLRSGRFDRKVMVPAPTVEERKEIFEYYLKSKKVSPKVDLGSLCKRTTGLVGADIENIVNEAALKVAKDNRLSLGVDDFEYALEKVLMGPEKKIKRMKGTEREIIAYHELGHAVTAHLLDEADDVEKISIVRRGHALGATWKSPQEDEYLQSKAKFLAELTSMLGGRAAEEIFVGKKNVTTGASNDFQRATKMVSDMITKYGMDEELGLVVYSDDDAKDFVAYKPFSEKTAELIDKKIKEYLDYCYKEALKILKANKAKIEVMKDVILKKEYLTKAEFGKLMEDKKGKTKGE